jgi:sterol desaturase/sphingolipid hydroxylase (fatty acid hydroxylase superfamily)
MDALTVPPVPPVLLAVLAAIEIIVLRRRGRPGYDLRETASSLTLALLQPLGRAATVALWGGVIAWLWQQRIFTVPLDRPGGLLLLFLAVEFAYYWMHRASHQVHYLWASHCVHHSVQHFNFSAALRLGLTSGVSGAVIAYLPLVWLGFDPRAVFAMLAFNLAWQFGLHTETIGRLGPLEWLLNTPSHHRAHHAVNARYLDCNFGGVLIIFDRLFGTFERERDDEPCRYGLVTPPPTQNPLAIALYGWRSLLADLRWTQGWRSRLRVLFGPPGWRASAVATDTRSLRAAAGLAPRQPCLRRTGATIGVTLALLGGAAVALWSAGPAHAQVSEPLAKPLTIGGQASLSSEHRLRGISLSDGLPSAQLVLEAHLKPAPDWEVSGSIGGTAVRNVADTRAQGVALDFGLALARQLGAAAAVDLSLQLTRFPLSESDPRRNITAQELSLGLALHGLRAAVSSSLGDYLGLDGSRPIVRQRARREGSRGSSYLSLDYEHPIGESATISLGGGRQIVRNYAELSYNDWRASVAASWIGLRWTLAVVGANTREPFFALQGDGTARDLGATRAVLTTAWRF